MTHRGPRLLLAASLLGLASCDGGGGGDGGPSGPTPPPAIASVTPAEARAGEQVTIAGSNFGSSASAVAVAFRGEPATVDAVSDASITATVPEIAPGDAAVVVTVSGRASDPAAFRVLQSPPVVTSVEPDPVRAGETLEIRGRNFTTEPDGMRAAQGTVQVTIGVRLLTVDDVFFDRIGVTLPFDLEPGSSELTVRVGELASDPFPIDVHTFSVGGFWWPSMSSSVTFNDCGFGAAVGDPFLYGFTLADDGSGSLDGFYNGVQLIGELGLELGTIDLSGSIDGTSVEVGGTAGAGSTGERSLDLEFDFSHASQGCRIQGRVFGERLTEEPIRYVGGVSVFDGLHDSGEPFTQVTGNHDRPILDATVGYSVGTLSLSVTGQSFAFQQGGVTLLDFVSGSLLWRLEQADLAGIDEPVPGPFCLWAPQNGQTVTGALLDGGGSTLFSQDFSAGQEIRMQLPFRPNASDARYTESGDASGFSRFELAYSGFFDAAPPSDLDTSMAEICDLRRGGYGGY